MTGARHLADYVMEQLEGLEGVRNIPMMGGYVFYYKERIFGGIYENGFLVKDTPAARVPPKKYLSKSIAFSDSL